MHPSMMFLVGSRDWDTLSKLLQQGAYNDTLTDRSEMSSIIAFAVNFGAPPEFLNLLCYLNPGALLEDDLPFHLARHYKNVKASIILEAARQKALVRICNSSSALPACPYLETMVSRKTPLESSRSLESTESSLSSSQYKPAESCTSIQSSSTLAKTAWLMGPVQWHVNASRLPLRCCVRDDPYKECELLIDYHSAWPMQHSIHFMNCLCRSHHKTIFCKRKHDQEFRPLTIDSRWNEGNYLESHLSDWALQSFFS